MLGRPRLSPAGVSDATKVRQANRRLHRRLELAHQAKQNLLDDQLAGLDRRVMRKRELPSVLSPNYDDAVQQMAHSEISLALKCLREVAMRTALERLRDLRLARSLEDQAERVDAQGSGGAESYRRAADGPCRQGDEGEGVRDEAEDRASRAPQPRSPAVHLQERAAWRRPSCPEAVAGTAVPQGGAHVRAAARPDTWPRSGEEMLDIAEVNAWA